MFSSADVAALVGSAAMSRAQDYVDQGRVLSVARSPDGSRVVGHVEGTRREPYVAVIEMSRSGEVPRAGRCSCPVGRNCKHVAATLLAFRAQGATGVPLPARGGRPEWESALAPLIDGHDDAAVGLGGAPDGVAAWDPYGRPVQEVALQVELQEARTARRGAVRFGPARLALRPVVMGARERWIRTGISWRELRYQRSSSGGSRLAVLRALYGLASGSGVSGYGFDDPTWIFADDMPGSVFWAVLADARRAGLPVVASDRAQTPVRDGAARSVLRVLRAGADLTVFAEVLMDRPTDGDGASDGASGDEDRSDALDEAAIPVGNPAFGVVAQPGGGADADSGGLVLAPLTTPLDATALDLVARPHGLTVPHDDEPRFLRQVLPLLAERFDVLEVDDSITLPEPPHPVLTLRVTRFVEHVAHLSWRWRYVSSTDGAVAEAEFPVAARRGADAGSRDRGRSVERTGHRDRALEAAVLERLGPRLGREVDDEELRGITTAEFFSNDLPGLLGLASRDADLDVELLVDADAPAGVDYRSGTEVDVSVDVAPSGGRDWFDLGILVHVDGRSIPFSTIFTALATGQNKVLMPDGLHFRLDDPRFERLREILDESGALQDSMGGKIRVGRYQAELFDELDRLGLIDAQAAEWRAALGALAGGAQPEHVDVPVGLAAELRGYQHEGFEWLVFLAEHGLGGVLADDMGLGKTVQTLAAVQRAHERAGFRAERDAVAGAGTRPAPVLVVAPTSVVDNWVAEAHRFTPGLKAVAVRATRAKRQAPLAETVGDADVVVTSYALFRLDAEEYQSVEWSGLVLDEAQFVKNRQSVAYRCARELAAPFKLALTGTPLENNLMELWSILSIVSPGLFPDPHRFADFYAGPIEREGHEARLELLRRKVTPFLLRRTKEDVAKDLPARQEQITEVTLQPRHRRVYDQYLQRERKNVLGLVDELDSNRFKVFRSLTVLRQASLDVSLVDESHAGVPSSKLDVLFEMLDDVLAEGHNVLVFSQFTQFLRRVRDRLDAAGTDYAYLDGRTRKRAAAIEKFTSGEAKLFLVSLKAGGFGLNLTAADYCILLDPWWNPAAEQQAVDRAHRIGQTRQVMVYRLVAADTIEDKVMTLKAAKSKLFASVLDGGTSASSGITADDVRALLG